MKIQKNQKIDWRSIVVDYVSIYSLTILVTTLIQAVIFKVETQILLTCLLKSLFSSVITVGLVLWGLQSPKVQRHPALMALIYPLSNIPYSDIVIMYMYMYHTGINTILQIFGTYFIFYFVIGFFISKYVYYAKRILDKIIGMYTIFIPKKAKDDPINRDPQGSLFFKSKIFCLAFLDKYNKEEKIIDSKNLVFLHILDCYGG